VNETPPVSLLSLQDIDKHYAGVQALKRARFEIVAGEVHALMGENGAGKSTLARIAAGAVRPDAGEIHVEGRSVSISRPRDAQQLGIGIIHQELDLFPHLTVGENIVIGNLRFAESALVSRRRIEAFCRPYLEQVGLTCATQKLTAVLPIGQRQLLAIARALSMDARVLFMDEPTSSLSEEAAERLFALVASLRARGVGIVYVSHKMEEIFRISDRMTVLRDGETIGTRRKAATSIDEIIQMMVGRAVDRAARPARAARGPVRLSVSGLTTRKLRDVSFKLHAGEVVGVAGLVGAGRSSLGAALFGLDRIEGGALQLSGREFTPKNPAHAMRSGLGLLPEDRKLQGLMMQMSVRENGSLSVLPRVSRLGFVRERAETGALQSMAERLRLKSATLDAPVGTLSGGNQQKTLLARVLLADPDILFLDDPARGIDVGAKEDIYRLIDELAARDKGVLLVSSELPELLRCSDRILVLNQGRITGTFDAREATPERIMAAATSPVADLRRVS
jgi:ABC-type sugar transport system ATPase subunit